MTQSSQLLALLPLLSDLTQDLPDADRYRRLLEGFRTLLPCDAAALLRLEGQDLVPVAVDGLTPDTMGRRFRVTEHPRLARILDAAGPVRFDPDSPLPDPYDGLVESVQGHLPVHDCLGCVLRVDGRPWGIITLDALETERFTHDALDVLSAFAGLAGASVAAAQRMEALTDLAEAAHEHAAQILRDAPHAQRQLIGQSPAYKALIREIALAGPSDLCVLIQGETGVGKELVARALHTASSRCGKPLVSLNCAALPDTLVESELFGHVRGAYTGAHADRRGKFELADGGTLFLDEVGELPLATQAKLLRVLQEGQVQRLGSDREHHVNVRVIAATNADLSEQVRKGAMRADFYHRLTVYPIRVPALRARGRDVLRVAGYFLEDARARYRLRGLRLDGPAQAALLAYAWPGNVRELEHVIGRAVIKAMGTGPGPQGIVSLGVAHLALAQVAADAPVPEAEHPAEASLGYRQRVAAFEEQLIRTALERHRYQWSAAARALKLDRANLARMAKRLGITAVQ
ncbi:MULTISPECIES: nitric oxide reductase transcriptional regulator NorR [Xanthomonas]|uniref:Nitric oxide reductase transcription regulator n=1 Tax=Xanthomonas cucurbitae TaxID=56453 RepID=A0A2S7DUQ9_9XANT|nr:nitric oxide reductase transcriptional regulator NorR [Xanthomonas cucurbitae]PPU77521.1 nitric oxide reductase transcription regulator [Xanthomonas cucurbitae]QHG86142.1 nitric oxide reductase transcriptional regulator NorR [Xanthomonas cucurbitae]WDM68387.1 nitric oxide reductase transcriptional regulator NorR [Xanthomonas cucurbitae]WDM72260.1 nitric oxide reductase transcriptional regulator NorR [Xanthomonas cucurbitae]WDM76055.1 nitric oxide reductase transcriptional regulator NorR [Xa